MGLLDRLAPRKERTRRSSAWTGVGPRSTIPCSPPKPCQISADPDVARAAGPARPRPGGRQQRQFFRRAARLQDFRRGHLRRSRSARPRQASSRAAGVPRRSAFLRPTARSTGSCAGNHRLSRSAGRAGTRDAAARACCGPTARCSAFSASAPAQDARYTKFIIVDEVNLKYRSYPAARGRQAILLNRDIIRLFSDLRVSDSFLLKNNLARNPVPQARMSDRIHNRLVVNYPESMSGFRPGPSSLLVDRDHDVRAGGARQHQPRHGRRRSALRRAGCLRTRRSIRASRSAPTSPRAAGCDPSCRRGGTRPCRTASA